MTGQHGDARRVLRWRLAGEGRIGAVTLSEDPRNPLPTPDAAAADPPHPALGRNAALARASQVASTFSLRFLLILAALFVFATLVGKIWFVVLPVLLSLLLSTILWPPVRVLRRHGWPPGLAAGSVLLIALLLLAGLVGALAPQVTGQSQELADSVSAGLDDLQARLERPPFNLDDQALGGGIEGLIAKAQDNAQSIASRVVSGVGIVGTVLVEALLALVLTFFSLKDGPKFLPWLGRLAGPTAAPHLDVLASRSWGVLGGFVRAQAAVGLVDAVFIGVGLWILGVPLALPLAVLVFFFAFIPIVGAFVSGAIAALVALVTGGPGQALVVILIVLAVQQIEGNLLQPVLVGRTLDLHPAVVLLAVTAGGSLRGVTGAFLAVPVVSVLAVVIRYVREQLGDPHDEPLPEAGSDDRPPRSGLRGRLRPRPAVPAPPG
ncbi:MAG: perM [Frankiales bacterium]|nr:perM [Frankiales bacterium]